MQNMETSASTNNNSKKRTIDQCVEAESPARRLEETNLSTCLVQAIIETKRHNIYCISTPDGLRAVKTSATDNPTPEEIQNLENELKFGSQISCFGVRKSYARTTYNTKEALLLEWANGNQLSDLNKVAIPNFLKIARGTVSSLLEIHTNKMCHLSLTCDHIILDSDSNSTKIIGCGSSSSFSNKLNHNPYLLGKDLRYISPEQTGRVNREVDYRSDFYSLGVIFYRLLSGRHPFESASATDLI